MVRVSDRGVAAGVSGFGRGGGDGGEQAGEVFAAGAAGAQVRCDPGIASLGGGCALCDDGVGVDVEVTG